MYQGQNLYVRPLHKKNGETAFALCRPVSGAVMDQFQLEQQADFIAEYIDVRCQGDYSAGNRKAARRGWTEKTDSND